MGTLYYPASVVHFIALSGVGPSDKTWRRGALLALFIKRVEYSFKLLPFSGKRIDFL